ncbi:MAG: hypothetical protein KatS3mg110_0946 [Pirellulaceae bacterium]|nr:MAG: hypothetical protein KatS3mg110_0946 [Pirellulaceae bacterium]
MFDDVLGILDKHTEAFRDGVRDQFGASVIADVLDPIRREIEILCSFHEDVQQQALNIAQVLEEARSITLAEGSQQCE